MLFTSFSFLGLVLITFIIYYIPKLARFQVQVLIAASLFFYAYSQPYLVLLLLFSATVNIITSYLVITSKPSARLTLATAGVVINLVVLAFFKYSPLIGRAFFSANSSIEQFLVNIPLPIGISFFTFEGISLVVDVYKDDKLYRDKLVSKSLIRHIERTLLFISFFPHLIAGPILKARDFLPQIQIKKISDIDYQDVFRKLIVGYFLKMVVADNLKEFTYFISFPYFQGFSTITLLTMLYGYSCQIFADFAGYSLIAIGFAKLFGYQFNANFNFPYISCSFKEFWKRWHISLSSFLMEYLYFPLGGNKKGKVRTYINLIITMILGGLWHGAAWSYAVWGAFHGLALAGERFISEKIKIRMNGFLKFIRWATVFLFVTLAWLLFKLPEFSQVVMYFKSIFSNMKMDNNYGSIIYIILYSLPVIVYHMFYIMREKRLFVTIKKREYIFYGIMLFMIITNSGSAGYFIYFQF